MFKPIEAPDVHRGPATGHTTEFGTTWQEAVERINAAFKELFEQSSTGLPTEFVSAVTARFEHLEGVLSDALFKLEAQERTIIALITPAEPPPADTPASDPPVPDPAPVEPIVAADAAPMTSTSTIAPQS